MSLPEPSNVREVYERYTSHAELLKHIKQPAVKKVAHCIRSWKSRHSLATLEQAFAEHRQSILFPQPQTAVAGSDKQVATSTDAATSPITDATSSRDSPSSSLPSRPPSVAPSPAAPSSTPTTSTSEEHEEAQLPACTTGQEEQQQQRQQQQSEILAGLVRDVAALRGLQLQHTTPSPLSFTSIAKRLRNECRVLSIVGDGRCQLYSLLQAERAMLPTAYEADELRKLLKGHLLRSYTEDEWRERVPCDLREIISLQQFAERYLSHNTAHLPHDSIVLWQDVRQRQTDVFILNKTPQGEHVEKVPCRKTAHDAVVLLFTWRGVGHYELVTYNNVICLPCQHPFILHLDELHGEYISGLSKEVKRATHRGKKRTAAEREGDVVVEDEAATSTITSSTSMQRSLSADQQHLCKFQQEVNALRVALEERIAEIDTLTRLNAQLAEQLRRFQRNEVDRLPQPKDSPATERELRRSAAFMHHYLRVTVPPTPNGLGMIILHPPPSLGVPPTPADPCCICRIESADASLSPCKHRCCQACWTKEKKALVRMNNKKRRKSRELDLPIEPLVFLCPLCRQMVKDNEEVEANTPVEPSTQVGEPTDPKGSARGRGRGKGRGRGRGSKRK